METRRIARREKRHSRKRLRDFPSSGFSPEPHSVAGIPTMLCHVLRGAGMPIKRLAAYVCIETRGRTDFGSDGHGPCRPHVQEDDGTVQSRQE